MVYQFMRVCDAKEAETFLFFSTGTQLGEHTFQLPGLDDELILAPT